MIVLLIQLAMSVASIAGLWKIFEKFGEPGWAAIIPIYNIYIMFKIIGWEPIKILFLLIPLFNIYIMFMAYKELAAKFGKDSVYAIGMLLLPFVFLPLLGFNEEVVA